MDYQFSITDLINNGFDVTVINVIKSEIYGDYFDYE